MNESNLGPKNMGEQELKLEEVFESAVAIVRNLPKEGPIKPSDGLKLKLYALFKQATHGPNDTRKPKFYQFVEGYKWDAWLRLGDMSKEEAMLKYIEKLKKIMDTVPQDPDTVAMVDNEHFKEILGKKFYDYWFNEWNNQKSQELTASLSGSSHLIASTSSVDQVPPMSRPNDTHSSSSDNSSMSMLEDTQSPDGDGFKTPNSLDHCNITGQVHDQFALAVLRLQHGLDETNSRLNKIESQVARTMESLQSLQNQTHVKHPVGSCDCSCRFSDLNRGQSGLSGKRLISVLSRMGAAGWFYLSYPIVIYALLRAFEKRKSRLGR